MKNARRDPLVALAPLTFALSILFIFAWKADFFTILALVSSLIVLLSNFHALFRYSEHLYVDHYSVLMKVWAFFTMILSTAAIILLIFFYPYERESSSIGITETKTRLDGSFRTGFTEASNIQTASAEVFEFTLIPEISKRTNVILFIPDKRADTYNYRPFIQELTKQGFTVFSGDFYTSDCKWLHSMEDMKILRRFALTLRSLLNNQKFISQREFYSYNISHEIDAMYKIITEKYGDDCKVFLVSDVMGNIACNDFLKAHKDRVIGHFSLDTIEDYKTPGYGFVSHTDPIIAYVLKTERQSYEQINQIAAQVADKNLEALGIKRK